MKRIITLLALILFFTSFLFSVEVATIPVEFTAGITHNIGFSKSMVSGSIDPGSAIDSVEFTVSSDFTNYTTGIFYMYLQLFTDSAVSVYIASNPLKEVVADGQSGTAIGFSNTGSNTSSRFGSIKATGFSRDLLFEEANADTSYPRTYNFEFNLTVPINNVVVGSSYSGVITISLETKE